MPNKTFDAGELLLSTNVLVPVNQISDINTPVTPSEMVILFWVSMSEILDVLAPVDRVIAPCTTEVTPKP